MTASALYRISTRQERDILAGFARGISLAALTAQHGEYLATLMVQEVAGFDRGRARAAVMAYDADNPPATATTVGPSSPAEVELRSEIDRLKALLKSRGDAASAKRRQLEKEIADLKQQLAEATFAPAPAKCTHPRIADVEAQMVAAEEKFAAELKQFGAHLTHAQEMADLYKARLDRLHELVGWCSQDNGALITIAAVRKVLDDDRSEP